MSNIKDHYMDDFDQLKTLFKAHRFSELMTATAAVPDEGKSNLVLALQARSLFHLGRFRHAGKLLSKVNADCLSADDQMDLVMWNFGFLALLNGNPLEQLGSLSALCGPNYLDDFGPIYHRTKASLTAMAIEYYQLPATEAVRTIEDLKVAYEGFLVAAQHQEAIECLLLEANLWWQLIRDNTQSGLIYRKAIDAAGVFGDPVLLAQVRIQQVEFELVTTLDQQTEQQIQQSFAFAACVFETHSHPRGAASVCLATGRVLEKYGYSADNLVEEAFASYQQQGDWGGMAECLSLRCQNYLKKGHIQDGLPLTENLLEVALDTGFPIRIANAYLTRAEYLSRAGVYAQAIYFADQACKLIDHPAIKALYGLTLSQFYLRIDQPLNAIRLCEEAISSLQKGAASKVLSSAYYFLGITKDAQGNWFEAIQAFTSGNKVASSLGDVLNASRQQASLHFTSVKRDYELQKPISDRQYQDFIVCFELLLLEINNFRTAEAYQLEAEIRQYQCITAQFASRAESALRYLELAEGVYNKANLAMEAATTRASMGLIAWERARQGETVLFDRALIDLQLAEDYFDAEHLNEQLWRIQFNQAACWWDKSSLIGTDRMQSLVCASKAFSRAAETVDILRTQFTDRDINWQDSGKRGVLADKEQFYLKAIRFHLVVLGDSEQGFYWVERFKGRIFTEMLAGFKKFLYKQAAASLTLAEEELDITLQKELNPILYYQLTQKRRQLWIEMKSDPETEAYARLRLGEALQFQELKAYLAS